MCFNSRTLGRVRLLVISVIHSVKRVSIHAPWEGCDVYGTVDLKSVDEFQFTHPGKGATISANVLGVRRGSFNSRTLGRVRPLGWSARSFGQTFQFTHPGKGATEEIP